MDSYILSKQELVEKQMKKDVEKYPVVTLQMRDEIKLMRKVTGLGMEMCKLSILRCGNMWDAIAYLRSMSDEPDYEGLTSERWDVVDEEGNVVFSCKHMEHGRCFHKHRIRFVDSVGFYSYLK